MGGLIPSPLGGEALYLGVHDGERLGAQLVFRQLPCDCLFLAHHIDAVQATQAMAASLIRMMV